MTQSALRDIHLPDPVSWWPPAPGWWLLALVVLVLSIITPRLIKHFKNKPINKIALIEFNKIEQTYKNHQNQTQLAQDISILLRRICMSYRPRQEIASLTGKDWIDSLNKMSESPCFSEQLAAVLFNAPYQKQAQFDSDELIDCCKNWIKQLPRRNSI